MKKYDLRTLFFLTLCCDLGLLSKRLISPAANLITDALHIPGGIGTSFSLMFLVIASALTAQLGCAALMGAVQSGIALAIGMVGSMGALSVIGYVMPGIVIDGLMWQTRRLGVSEESAIVLANATASVCASMTANWIVFRLTGVILLLYVCVSVTSGALCGMLGAKIARRLRPVLPVRGERKNCGEQGGARE